MKKMISVLLCLIITIMLTININALSIEKLNKNTKNTLVYNILLIGKDVEQISNISRADTMVILTIDELNQSIKFTSLARDTLVDIPGKGYEKLTHAYAYGKEKLLLDTINKNFKLDIKDYAVVDFVSFIRIIDILGGVEVDINEKEIDHLNEIIKSSYGFNYKNKGNIKYIDNTGIQNLNGYQALAYARIRKIDTIYRRDERQREILNNLTKKLSNTSISNYISITKNVLNYVDLNISLDKITQLSFLFHELASYDIKQLQFPIQEYREDTRLNGDGKYVVKWDENENIKALHQFIYGK